MPNKVMERIMTLVSEGYEISFRQYPMDGSIVIRLTKDGHNVEQIADQVEYRMLYAWQSDEEWFLYILTNLEFKYQNYVKD